MKLRRNSLVEVAAGIHLSIFLKPRDSLTVAFKSAHGVYFSHEVHLPDGDETA